MPTDKAEFLRVLNGLAMIKPGNAKLTEEVLDLWWAAMRDWTIADFKAAATHLAKSVEFMPSPFHFEQLRKAGRPVAGEAWAAVLEYVRQGTVLWDGGYREFSEKYTNTSLASDPVALRAVAALGGFQQVAMCQNDQLPFMERRFCEHYETMQDSEEVRVSVPQIANTHASMRLRQMIREATPQIAALAGEKPQ